MPVLCLQPRPRPHLHRHRPHPHPLPRPHLWTPDRPLCRQSSGSMATPFCLLLQRPRSGSFVALTVTGSSCSCPVLSSNPAVGCKSQHLHATLPVPCTVRMPAAVNIYSSEANQKLVLRPHDWGSTSAPCQFTVVFTEDACFAMFCLATSNKP